MTRQDGLQPAHSRQAHVREGFDPVAPGEFGWEAASRRPGETAEAALSLSADDWLLALERLDRLVRNGRRAAAAELRTRLLYFVWETARGGKPAAAGTLLEAYLARNPHDPDAYLLASDLEQMQGRSEAALTPLFDLLAFADDPAVVRRARDKLALLVNAREAHLANTGDIAGLIRMFRRLVENDPGFDGHRLRLARWQLRAGRVDEAERTLSETGTAGVDPEAREDLAAEISLARVGLPLQREDGALHVSARMAGRPLTMLVDTGATTTAISRDRAAALNATPTGKRVQVRTANGTVTSEVHRVADVEIGPLHLESLAVLVLDGPLPRDADGLLGMDVLGRFPPEAAWHARPGGVKSP